MSSYTLIIGNKNYSSWSLRPWIWMKQVGIEFTEQRIALFTDDTDKQLEPYFSDCKVPILLDKSFVVWDTLSILEYLAEKHPEKDAWPKDQQARAIARSASAEMHSSFLALRNALPMNCRKQFDNFGISAEVQKDIDRVTAIWKLCKDQFGHDNSPWLFGHFTIADAMFAPVALRFHGYNVALENAAKEYVQTIVHNPFVMDWIESGKQEKEIIEADEA